MTIQLLLQQSFNALQLGSVYALIALGYTMVYGILTLINFAHGDIFTVSCYLAPGSQPVSPYGRLPPALVFAATVVCAMLPAALPSSSSGWRTNRSGRLRACRRSYGVGRGPDREHHGHDTGHRSEPRA